MNKNQRDLLIQHHIWQVIARADCWLTRQDIIEESHDYYDLARSQLGLKDLVKATLSGARGRFSLLPPHLLPSEIGDNLNELVVTREYVMPESVTAANLTELWNERFGGIPAEQRRLTDLKEQAKFWGGKVYSEQLPLGVLTSYKVFCESGNDPAEFPLGAVIEVEQSCALVERETGDRLRPHFEQLLKSDPASPELVVYFACLPLPDDLAEDDDLRERLRDSLMDEGVFPSRPLPASQDLEKVAVQHVRQRALVP